jgi:hypothetical protein
MKLSIRFFLALLLSFALPINGMAQTLMAAHFAAGSASSEAHAEHAHGHAEHGLSAMTPCAAEHDSNGLICDTGQECKTSGILQLHVAESTPPAPDQPQLLATLDFLPLLLPEPLWHPPRT